MTGLPDAIEQGIDRLIANPPPGMYAGPPPIPKHIEAGMQHDMMIHEEIRQALRRAIAAATFSDEDRAAIKQLDEAKRLIIAFLRAETSDWDKREYSTEEYQSTVNDLFLFVGGHEGIADTLKRLAGESE